MDRPLASISLQRFQTVHLGYWSSTGISVFSPVLSLRILAGCRLCYLRMIESQHTSLPLHREPITQFWIKYFSKTGRYQFCFLTISCQWYPHSHKRSDILKSQVKNTKHMWAALSEGGEGAPLQACTNITLVSPCPGDGDLSPVEEGPHSSYVLLKPSPTPFYPTYTSAACSLRGVNCSSIC